MPCKRPTSTGAAVSTEKVALEDLLADLREEYARKLPEKLARLELLWHGFANSNDAEREDLLRAVHSIAGSAATFGLPELGAVALELELALRPLCASSGVPDDEDRRRIEEGIAHLRSAAPHRGMNAGGQ